MPNVENRRRDQLGRFANEYNMPSTPPLSAPNLPARAETPWEQRYHKVFQNFHRKTLTATRELFSSRPSELPSEEVKKTFTKWVEKVSANYGMEPPKMYWDQEAFYAGGGYYQPANHSITLNPERPSITTLLHEFRHALQSHQKGPRPVSSDKEIDARAWSLSLYYQVKPNLFKRLVSEGRIFHIDPNVFR